MEKKITPQLMLTRMLDGISMLLMGGVLYFFAINWMNSGDWGIGSVLSLIAITLISAILKAADGNEDEAQPTWKSIGKGLVAGLIAYLILGIMAAIFSWPAWAILLITGFSIGMIPMVATDKDVAEIND